MNEYSSHEEIDDLDDKFSSYMCNLFSKTLYSARFFNDLIQIV
jgi:hypothetical protein